MLVYALLIYPSDRDEIDKLDRYNLGDHQPHVY